MQEVKVNDNESLKYSGLNKTLLNKIINTIRRFKKVDKIILFGSRAQQRSTRTSDIDIAIVSKNWSSTDVNLVHNRLEETIPTIYQFDVIHYDSLQNDILKKEIEKGITIYAIQNDFKDQQHFYCLMKIYFVCNPMLIHTSDYHPDLPTRL